VEEEITVRYGPALSDEGSSARGDDGEEVAEDLPDVPIPAAAWLYCDSMVNGFFGELTPDASLPPTFRKQATSCSITHLQSVIL